MALSILKFYRSLLRSRALFQCNLSRSITLKDQGNTRYAAIHISRNNYCTIQRRTSLVPAPTVASSNPRLYCSTSGQCWNCHAELSRAVTSDDTPRVSGLFCPACNMIQPLQEELNHFQIMGIKESFDIEPSDLTKKFRNLQRLLHPDKFGTMSQTEQTYSALQSSAVNRAYRVLLKPLSRGLYLLELNGHSIEEGDSNLDPGFLMELMEKNEELADATDPEVIRQIGKDNAVMLDALQEKLQDAFSSGDFPAAREILMRLKYVANIDEKVKEKLGTD